MKIQEVIVVEGKADTEVLRHAVEADTIETNGSALSDATLQAIQRADAKHAFLTKDEAGRQIKHHSLGIEYASADDIRQALSKVYTASDVDMTSDITRSDLVRYGLMAGANAAQRREHVSERLGLGYVNGKQLLKRLNMFGVTNEELKTILQEMDEEN